MNRDEFYMREAIRIARNAVGRTSPNPLVGAVIVKDDRIIAEGWHRKAGELHAERNALIQAGNLAEGSTMYVTLEPCSHYGRTPPCANALVDAKIARCVVAMTDPNPKVAGRGLQILNEAGIETEVGICKDESKQLNEFFLKWITEKIPFVALKYAMTIDGKISGGNSKYISNQTSLRKVHELRDTFDGILVGIGTVLADNPSLTTRFDDRSGKNPVRIILDSNARIPLDATVLTDQKSKTIVAVTDNASEQKIDSLNKLPNVEVISTGNSKRVDLKILMKILAEKDLTSILVEGGSTVNFSLLENNLVDKIFAFVAPKIFCTGKSPIDGASLPVDLKNVSIENLDGDILISGYVR